MTIKDLTQNPSYYLHHAASRRGYESRKGSGHIEPYSGKFGTGYLLVLPRYDTTRYVRVEYYIKRG